ncbi:hypothetical protein GCM10007863_08710 [Dyella mobilis]|nr:hypothetical protein GCM10007863_08710 [Dyella mobilis]
MIACARCRHFQPGPINPQAGMGRCMHDARHGYWHPEAMHSCYDFVEPEAGVQKGKTGIGRDSRIRGTSTASEGAR